MMFGRKGRRTPLQREPLADLEDIRDDCIAVFINSGMTQKQVHAAGGPTPQTISKWLYKETHFPRLDTVRAFYRAVAYDLIPVPLEDARVWRATNKAFNAAHRMPKRRRLAKQP